MNYQREIGKEIILIVENTEAELDELENSKGYGLTRIVLTQEHVAALLAGKAVAFGVEEFICSVALSEAKK